MEQIKINDLYKYKYLSDVVVSPKGDYFTFTVTMPMEKDNAYSSKLYCYDIKSSKYYPLTGKGKERSCIWLDENNILYSSPQKGGEGTTYYKQNVSFGEREALFTIPTKVSSIKKITEDLYLVTSPKSFGDPMETRENHAKEGRDFHVFDEIPFWKNAQGVQNKKRNQGFLYTPSTNELKKFTKDSFLVAGTSFNSDKTKLLYWGTDYTDKMSTYSEVFEYDIYSGHQKAILEPEKLAVNFAIYFDGKIIIEGSEKKICSSQGHKLYAYENGEIHEFADFDGTLGSTSSSDMAYGAGNTLKVLGDKVYVLQTSWGNSFLSKIGTDCKLTHINETVGSINCFDIAGNMAYCVAFRDFIPQEIYSINLETGAEKKLSSFSGEFCREHEIIKPDYFVFKNRAGIELDAWVLKPVGYDETKKYAGVLSIHGGPKVAFGTNYNHEMECLAHSGMFVFYTNPRGSSGRGEEFSRLVGNLGKIDYEDLMDFTDEVLSRYPSLDANRLGVIGGSYGGFMTNWIVGQTTRFKAAVAQRSISNYFTKSLTTDIGYYHNLNQTGASPWENPEQMWYHSPLSHVDKVETPLLFIQADEDYRCWLSEPLQMFSALKQRGIPSKIALFHGENHELSRTGKPKNRISRLTEITNWLIKYLK